MLQKDFILIEQSKSLSRHINLLRFTNIIVCLLIVVVLSQHFSTPALLAWLLLSFLVLAFTGWLTRTDLRDSNDLSKHEKRLNVLTFCFFLQGLSWGLSGYYFLDSSQELYLAYQVIVNAAFVSIWAASTAAYFPAYIVFSIANVSCYLARFIKDDSLFFTILAFSAVIYFLVMLGFAWVMHRNFISSKIIEHDNILLLDEVTKQKFNAEQSVIEKNNFLAATSHDLRQPLHAMNLYIDALRPRLSDKVSLETLNKVSVSASALNDLLHKLLDISRLDANVVDYRPRHLAFSGITDRIEEEFLPQAKESNLELIIDIEKQHIVYADPVLLERVIRNLFSNAIKYTLQGNVSLKSTLINNKILISVCDTGIGVAADKIPTIFSEFIQIDNPERDRAKGLGLGLSIVKRLCDLQDIELKFESQLNQGSQVYLTVATGEAGLVPIVETTQQGGLERLTILCIDDEEAIRDSMTNIIRSWKCYPLVASNGEGALQIVQDHETPIDIIICDLRLRNDESGIEVIESIREELNKDIPALIITGDTAVDRIELVRDANINVMYKPVRSVDLREQIKQQLNQP